MPENKFVAPLIALLLAAVAPAPAFAAAPTPLRVCTQRDNMPFSNVNGEGFENKLAALIATDLAIPIVFSWLPEPAGDALAGLERGDCDLIVGLPASPGPVATTRSYYWSSYVLIARADRGRAISSIKDPQLRTLKIGVASIGGDSLYSPPARALAQLGLAENLVGYPVDGSDSVARRARIIDAVTQGEVDVAAVWGPLAGFFVKRSTTPLTMIPIADTDEFSARKTHFELLGLQYEIAMGVRRDDDALRTALDRVLVRDGSRINALLRDYGVPLLEPSRLSAAAPRNLPDRKEAP